MHLNKILDQIKHHPLVGSEISAGNRYWVYYNKCDNVIQVMNHYTVAAAPAA